MKTKNSRKFLSLIMALTMIMTLLGGMTISASAFNGAGTVTSPYLIASVADLQQLATDVNGGNDFNGEYFQLTTNLNLSTVPLWAPIGGAGSGEAFAGTFDGDGYTISGLSITSVANHVGLFGDASADSAIMNLTVSGAAVSGGKNVGAVVGRTYGEVNGCAVSNNSFVESNGMGQGVGAVVGSAWGSSSKVIDCTATSSTVEGIAATTYVGGVVGKAEGAVQNCKNINTQVDSRLYAGGVIGFVAIDGSYDSNCTNSGWPNNVGGLSPYRGEIVGYNANVSATVIANLDDTYIDPITGVIEFPIHDNTYITINTTNTEPVKITGDGTTTFYSVTIDYINNLAADLTVEDLYVSGPASATGASGNVINFASGTTSNLYVSGTNVLETTNNNKAVIHVPAGVTLSIDTSADSEGDGVLYVYKSSMAAGIGSDINQASGVINFLGGRIFAKGSKTGPTIGGDAGVGDITISGGELVVVTKARGAGIGGSNQSAAGDVYVSGGNLTLITDFSAPALGPGQTAMGTPANIGDLYITGGSVKTMITQNAYSSWGLTTGEAGEVVTTIGSTTYKYYINEAAIKATKLTGPSSSPVYLCVIPVAGSGTHTVYEGSTLLYEGGLHDYFYTDSTTTIDNFSTIPTIQTDYNLYLYLTQGTHFLTVDNQLVIVTV